MHQPLPRVDTIPGVSFSSYIFTTRLPIYGLKLCYLEVDTNQQRPWCILIGSRCL